MDKVETNPKGFSAEGLARIAPTLQPIVDSGDLSGYVTLLFRHGEIAQVNTLGQRDMEKKLPMTRDTLFRIASMTKPVTSVAALMLMEEGKFRLSDPITKWAPEFKAMRVLKDPQGALNETVPAAREITFEDLFTHRSGLAYGFSSLGPIAHEYARVLGDVLNNEHAEEEWMKRLATLPLLYQPGERFHYSHSTDVLGFLVGRIAGMPFRDFLIERIFRPLGMPDTDFFVPPAKRNRAAVVYRMNNEKNHLEPVPFNQFDEAPHFCGGGGGLISTADDYLKFARMMLNKGELDGTRLLQSSTVELMCTNRLTPAQRAIPFLGAIPMWDGMGFGLGVSVIDQPEKLGFLGMGGIGSFGWPGAFGTWWQADPANDLIMIYLIQNSMPLEPGAIANLAAGQRMGGRVALPMFQRAAYDALTK
ncbi:MAG: beta-lactamase family protein [Alphaproteobacteria bacterium]|nr:beta-lactamase family protein [Alphaproteobacteria bacterium]MBL6937907.1 beta-lactamase family protein [Alphaproteobacteria bacterium]MBL7099268.1 beta-lactamase family protein [Alphaproteobacteria bacterium]